MLRGAHHVLSENEENAKLIHYFSGNVLFFLERTAFIRQVAVCAIVCLPLEEAW